MSLKRVIAVAFCTFTAAVASAQPDISVTKSGPAQAAPGADVAYSVTISNVGSSAAATAQLSDPTPGTMTFVSATQNNGPAFNCSLPTIGASGTVNCTLATGLLPGQSANFTITFNIPPDTPAGTTFTNQATGSSTTINPNPPETNHQNDVGTAATMTPFAPDIAVTKSGPAEAAAGSDVAYNVTISNAGLGAAATVELKDPIPPGMTFVSATQDSGPGFTCSAPTVGTNGTVDCTLEAGMQPGESASFTFTFNIPLMTPPSTTFVNQAEGKSTTIPPIPPDTADENNVGVAATSTPAAPSSDFSLTKTAQATAPPGADVPFTITVTNAGATADATWTDHLTSNLTFVSLVQNSGPLMSCGNSTDPQTQIVTVTCTTPTFTGGATAIFTLTLHIPNNAATGSEFSNSATVTTTANDPNEENNTSGTGVTVSTVDASVTKSGPPTANAGTNIAYVIDVANAGPDATDITITDILPPGTTFVSMVQNTGAQAFCTGPSAGANGTVTCTVPLVPALGTAQFTLTINVGGTTSVTNTATVTTSGFDTNNNNDSSQVTTTITPQADMTIVKSAPASVNAGQTLTWTITATNNGPSTATGVTVTDTLPPGTTFASATPSQGSCGGTTLVTCNLGTILAGANATISLVANVSPAATGTIANTATVTAATGDPNLSNNSSPSNTNVVASADLSIVKSGPATVVAGTNITWTIVTTNNGPATATGVTVTDTLPANTSFVSANATQGSCSGTTTVTCSLGTINPTANATVTLVATVSPSATGVISNTATASTTAIDPTPNNTSTANTGTNGSADLTIGKTASASATAGGNITYTVTTSNAGPSSAVNVVLTDTLPPNTTFVSATQTFGPTFNCSTPAAGAPGTITCTIASFAPSATATFSFVVAVNPAASGTIANTASVSSSTPDPTPANTSPSASTAINPGPTDVSIVKTPDTNRALPGTNVTYTLLVTNNGPGTAASVVVNDALPAGTTLLSTNTTQGSCVGTTAVTCSIGALAPSATATVTLLVQMPTALGTVSNTATVTSANTENVPANNTSTAVLDVVAQIPTLSTLALCALALTLLALAVRRM